MENEAKFMEVERVHGTASKMLATFFALHTKQNNNILETLAAIFYSTERFRAAVEALEIIPSAACDVIESEMKKAAREDASEKITEELKSVLKSLDKSEEGE